MTETRLHFAYRSLSYLRERMMYEEVRNLAQTAIITLGPALLLVEFEADALDLRLQCETPLRRGATHLQYLYEQMLTPGAIEHQSYAARECLDPALGVIWNEIEVQEIKRYANA